jgi:hypothetical protein
MRDHTSNTFQTLALITMITLSTTLVVQTPECWAFCSLRASIWAVSRFIPRCLFCVINRCHYFDTPTGIGCAEPSNVVSTVSKSPLVAPDGSSRMCLSSKTDLTACMDAMSSLIGTDSPTTPWLSCYLQQSPCHCLCHSPSVLPSRC